MNHIIIFESNKPI